LEESPFEGVRVIELAQWVFAPAAGALLADWGADVIRIEPPTGDPYGGLTTQGIGRDSPGGVNLSLAVVNRGKRSVVLDLTKEPARRALHDLLGTADVFITSLRAGALQRLGLDPETLMEEYPHLVYGRASGYGTRGPDANRAGFDASAYWARGGLADALTPPDRLEPIAQRGAMGDRSAAMALAFGIAGALVRVGRTGQGSLVDASLLATAMWTLTSDLLAALRGMRSAPISRQVNPLFGTYTTKDGRHIQLAFLQPDRYWAELCRGLGRFDLLSDRRFADLKSRQENLEACITELEAEFARRTFDEWKDVLQGIDVPWAPIQTVEELLEDPQVLANGFIAEVVDEDGPGYRLPAVPVQYDGRPPTLRRAPEAGEHTEEVLLEIGWTWERILALREAGGSF
jgi:crotonobetainyl-CoA:carnitine CoA-transferase CaiB-like acyl-CoA transferase